MHRDAVFDGIVHTHLVLREATARIGESADAEQIDDALRALAGILPDHFRAEERANGFFDHLRRSLDHDAEAQVDALTSEHVEMERELVGLLQPGAHDATWLARGRALARRLREHETREARLGVAGFETF